MAKTKPNTSMKITRSGAKFTASWKLQIKAKNSSKQYIRWRTYNGKKWSGWTEKKIGKKATSYPVTLSAASTITKVQMQTKIKKKGSGNTFSAYESCSATFTLSAPPAPKLSVENVSANQTKFSWTHPNNSTNGQWLYRCYYRTKCTATPNASSGWGAWTHAAASSYSYTDSDAGKTRIFQMYAKGPAGKSATVTQRHIIGVSPVATWGKVSLTEKVSQYAMTYSVNINGSTYSVDKIVPQYCIDKPTATMAPPGGASWTDGVEYAFRNKDSTYSLAITTTGKIGQDECLWARVKTVHDSIESYSAPYRVKTGRLVAPTLTISMGTPLPTGFTVNLTVDDAGTAVPGAYQQVFLEKASAPGVGKYIKIGTIPNGTSSKTITSAIDLTHETGYAIHVRNISADSKSMTSSYYSYRTTMPQAPTLTNVTATTTAGKVYLSWTNNWAAATGVIIAWTDDTDNWTSNDDPETYEIEEIASNWFITGLETGKTWHFRIRSKKVSGDSETLSPWSDDVAIDLSSAPAIPVLYLSDETITEDGMVTAYWSYVSTDGTGQISGTIVTATYDDDLGEWTYGNPIASTTTAQHIDIYAAEHGWTNGTSVYLALRTRSGSGGESEYSTPIQLVIADKPTVAISTTSLGNSETLTEHYIGDGVTDTFTCAYNMTATPTVLVDGTAATVSSYTGASVTLSSAPADGDEVDITYTTTDNNILDAMPLTATVTTANATTLTVALERAVGFTMIRPDGSETDGALGETVYVDTIPAEATYSISINIANLIGRLDDGAWYNLVATAMDDYGQSIETQILFKVHWAHQAWNPTATFVTDAAEYIARITPIADMDYYVSGDKCDIYRLGADQPERIIANGLFGTEYVDPYPAFGPDSGYKIVTVTESNDYITDANEIADYDTTDEDPSPYTQLDPGLLVIDFDGDRVELPYNISLDNSWEKDFQRTTYLGGSVVGDHNRAVTRDLKAKTVLVRGNNRDIAIKMRALARYAGLCHVRTPEGSSFVADVQVSEAMAADSVRIDYSLDIKKVDTVGFDGMTYADWSEQQ